MDIGQAALNAVLIVGQAFVVDAQEVQRGGVKVVTIRWVFSSFEADFVARAVAGPAFDAATENHVDATVTVICAAALATCFYMTVEMDRPFDGFLGIGSFPLRDAVCHMTR